ncbi:MAG TPA: hypothetical protein VFJ19_05660 [Nocardioidaceae bacterium]|nr:hypothetical protein [Nocardioidaceae bacterium]
MTANQVPPTRARMGSNAEEASQPSPIPHVQVTRTEPNRTFPGHELWFIHCCYCGKEHVHGDGAGHRVAHCFIDREAASAGYIIDAPEAR